MISKTSESRQCIAWRTLVLWALALLLVLALNAPNFSVTCRIWFYGLKSQWGELIHINTLATEHGVVTVTRRRYGRNGRQEFVVFLYGRCFFLSEFNLTRLIRPETVPDSPGYFASDDEPNWRIETDPTSEYLCNGKTKLLRLR